MKGNFRLAKGVLGHERRHFTTGRTVVYLLTLVRKMFQLDRQRLQNFVAGSEWQEDITDNGPLELLQFIHQFNLGISVPNIVLILYIFWTIVISVARSCERSFSKLKLIKNYLRSTMSNARLTNLAILSTERELADEIDLVDVISEFAARKPRKIRL